MSRLRPGEHPARGVVPAAQGAAQGGPHRRFEEVVEVTHQGTRLDTGDGHAAQCAEDQGHGRGGRKRVPGQIADGQQGPAVGQLHRVVPVAADEAAGRGREVVGGDVQGAGAVSGRREAQ